MKTSITTLQAALAYQLQGLSYAEKKVKEEFNTCSHHLTSGKLKNEIKKYIDFTDSKLLKLERMFNYLMQEPTTRKNDVIDTLLDETTEMLSYASSSHLKDILMISCIQNICAYKISSYKTAFMFSVELELDTVSDLIQQILEWETETGKTLGLLAIEEFNKLQRVDKLGAKGS
jgi:ferritin-like metal-binding protein YciE